MLITIIKDGKKSMHYVDSEMNEMMDREDYILNKTKLYRDKYGYSLKEAHELAHKTTIKGVKK